jgi:hypothetical protein
MVNNNNSLPILYPAFNKNLLEVESGNFGREKHNYIVDILLDKTVHDFVLQGTILGFTSPILFGGVGCSQYSVGDYVLIRTVVGSVNYEGIRRVLLVQNDSTIVVDGDYLGDITNGEVEVFRIFRNKLPANPEGRAIFDVNGYATGRVSEDFGLENVGIFNVPNSFDRFQSLSSEEYYQNFTTGVVQDNNGLIQIQVDNGETLEIGQTVQYINDTFATTVYNGFFQIVDIEEDGFGQIQVTLNKPFTVPVLSTGVLIQLPKIAINFRDFNQLTDEKIIFNGALSYPKIIDFDPLAFDMSTFTNAKFLTTAPTINKIKLNQRAYSQFFQTNNTTVTQFLVQVVDENGVSHDYIVQSEASPDNFLGIAVGTYDLNQIDPSSFIEIAPRGLPIIQECDSSYCVSLYGEDACDINGIQTTNFAHPYPNVLNSGTWVSSNANRMRVTVLDLEIGGIPQTVTPTGNDYNQATVTGQTEEEIYSNEIGLQTGLNIQSSDAYGSGLSSGHWIEVDQDQDFYMKVNLSLLGLNVFSGIRVIVEYRWDSSTCESTYRITNGIIKPVAVVNGKFEKKPQLSGASTNIKGWIGLTSTPINPFDISEQLCFDLDYTPYAYRGIRLLFEDRLGSFIGFNFNLKTIRRLDTSSDGFEVDRYQVEGLTTISRGFKTIQASYSEEWDLNSDFLTEEEVQYLEEAFTSPNVFIQDGDQVLPCVIKPKTETIPSKENNDLRRFLITIRVNGTQYSQRN